MGIWIAQPKLETGETIRWKSSAGHALSRWITSGGQLVVTDQRLLFQPNRFDAATGKTLLELPVDEVVDIEVVDRDPTVTAGGSRRRLGIKTSSSLEIFVVNNLKTKIRELRGLLLPDQD
jgi:hypothetical protein